MYKMINKDALYGMEKDIEIKLKMEMFMKDWRKRKKKSDVDLKKCNSKTIFTLSLLKYVISFNFKTSRRNPFLNSCIWTCG